jgi:kynurenine formamidase
MKEIAPATFAAEAITMAAHTGTHIDALRQIGEHQDGQGKPSVDGEPRLYAGPAKTVAATESASHQGLMQMNIAQMPPIITRGFIRCGRDERGRGAARCLYDYSGGY